MIVKKGTKKWRKLDSNLKKNETSLFLYGELKELAKLCDSYGEPEPFSDEAEYQDFYYDRLLTVFDVLEHWKAQYHKKQIKNKE
ncbi:hypothetical protein [Metamycoplasma auris]|uniref:hypothetical protein n=1 Tax=Metamycoplasma auris TaxID=51363 RepID=UPI00126735C4|nr:hypothetical protein [Metamycoplasma auris]